MADVMIQRWSTPASLDSVMSAKGGLEKKERTLKRKANMRINSRRASHSAVGDVFQFYDTLSSLYFPDPSSTESREDPLTFFDESFFFLDHLERNPRIPSPPPPTAPSIVRSPSPSPSASIASVTTAKAAKMSPFGTKIKPRQNNGYSNRVSFASMLSNCHDHRMSTIMETTSTLVLESHNPSDLPSPTISAGRVAAGPTLPHRRNRKKQQQSQPFPPRIHSSTSSTTSSTLFPSSTNTIKRLLLEYIKPYPTLPADRDRNRNRNGKNGVRPKISITPTRTPTPRSRKGKHTDLRVKQTLKHSETTEICQGQATFAEDGDEDWVLHGFFEIRRKD
ncbi:hypothetical protein FRC19_003211 [Serendipita sp. 401]|nr:hypothetical protein FRC19_003211 [Serendipita sp. 401]